MRLYAGPLLDGFHLDDSTEFGYWLDERRSELAHAYVGALLALASARTGRRRAWTRRHAAVASWPPIRTPARHAQALMHALDAAGDRAGAIQHAAESRARLRADLELEPDPNVRRAGRTAAHAHRPSVSRA